MHSVNINSREQSSEISSSRDIEIGILTGGPCMVSCCTAVDSGLASSAHYCTGDDQGNAYNLLQVYRLAKEPAA